MHASNEVGKIRQRVKSGNKLARGGRAGMTIMEERRLREALRRRSPSEPWVDAQFRDILSVDERQRPVVRRVHDPGVFPPGGAATAMIRCPLCDIFMPANAFENGACLDHAEHDSWGPSPSAEAIRGLQYRNLKLPEIQLPSESSSTLRREIKRHRENDSKGD